MVHHARLGGINGAAKNRGMKKPAASRLFHQEISIKSYLAALF
jgi:hypothetical protein